MRASFMRASFMSASLMRASLMALMVSIVFVATDVQRASGQSTSSQDNLSGMGSGKGHHRGSSEQKTDAQKPKADEKAYKAALDRIPDGGKYDPWRNVRQ
jgi:hypothetical protein